MATLRNLARMRTSTTGTGTITLGAAVAGFLSFALAGVTNGQTVSYSIRDGDNTEVGRGVYTSSGTTLTRVVSKSTNSDAAISLSGNAVVSIDALAEDLQSDVAITGGTITGITDLAVADGGTGASTAANARTNLGLGTMATQAASAVAITGGTLNGTSAKIGPHTSNSGDYFGVNAANTVSVSNTNSPAATDSGHQFAVGYSGAFTVDRGGAIALQGAYTTDAIVTFARIAGFKENGTDGNTAGYLAFYARPHGGTPTLYGKVGSTGGLVWGAPTGGDLGAGKINAVGVYDDSVLLTDVPQAWAKSGVVDLAYWDTLVPDLVVPERVEPEHTMLVPVMVDGEEDVLIKVEEGYRRGTPKTVQKRLQLWTPIYDEHGNGLDAVLEDQFDEVIVPEKHIPEVRTVREHYAARVFKDLLDAGLDPKQPESFAAVLERRGALPGLPSADEWEHGKFSTGEMLTRTVLAVEILTQAVLALSARVPKPE